ncbi:multiple monosaccharide ABC transporter permease [Acetivibrio clariflavus]|uniref:multiple monosaccharide ABC transporter permease n=1 Tax=Acetivibrio clariflavus TaxID=288965 RepID=UPI0031F553D0
MVETVKVNTSNKTTYISGSVKTVLKNNIRQYAMLIALFTAMIIFQIATKGIFLKPMNVTNLILQNSYVLILAIGMTLCILTGGNIDLSVGSVCAFIGGIVGTLIINMKMDVWLAILIAIMAGALIGVWQGFWIAYVRIPAFIVTLSGMLVFRGLTNTLLKGLTLAPFPESFVKLSSGYIPDFFNVMGINIKVRDININITALVVGILASVIYVFLENKKRSEKKKYEMYIIPLPLFIAQLVFVVVAINVFFFYLAIHKGVPIILAIITVLLIGYSILTMKTVPGRYIYAMGGNEKAAKLSGINTNKVLFLTYVNMSVLAAIAGIAFTARSDAASPVAGVNFELDAIAACFIGGASAYGGVGTVIGAVIGALFMGVLNNGMSSLGVGSDWQMTIKGLVLLAAVAFDVISKNRAKA